jgi:tetratricopeptide (TPR) repeat protein
MHVPRHGSIVVGLLVAAALAMPPSGARAGAQARPAVELGTIEFPTSAKPAAQAPFLVGVKALYNFEFDIAGDAFREAEKADPAFALAYWGEAMSFNHPLWAEQDLASARKVLERLAPTAAARAAKAPAGKERELIEAEDVLYGAGDKLARDVAYSQAMGRMHATYPKDDEISVMYALSLLGTARPGEKTTRNAMQAASIALDVFQRHPQHPGAAHFIIHAFDDPDHAILSLPAARAYSRIAPSAAHALHMPSHIFVQLGMWDDVIASNIVAYKAAVDLADKKNLPRGREDFHTLSWLQYAYLQEGKFADAQKCVDDAKAVAERNLDNPRIRDGYAGMKARQIVETEQWEKLALSSGPVKDGGAPGYDGSAAYVFAAGFSAAHLNDLETANRALQILTTMQQQAESGSNAYRAKPIAVMAKEVASGVAHMQNNTADAERLLKEAVAIEATMDAPSGPPEPLKPSFELYGQFLNATGRAKEAAAQFEQALARTPNRRVSIEGLRHTAPARSSQAPQGGAR